MQVKNAKICKVEEAKTKLENELKQSIESIEIFKLQFSEGLLEIT